jgi:hypothetical protein
VLLLHFCLTDFLSVCRAVQGGPGRRGGGAEPPGLLRRAHGLGPFALTSPPLPSPSYRRVVRSRRAGACWLVEVCSGRTVHWPRSRSLTSPRYKTGSSTLFPAPLLFLVVARGRHSITRSEVRVIGPLFPCDCVFLRSSPLFDAFCSRPTFWESVRCSSGPSRRGPYPGKLVTHFACTACPTILFACASHRWEGTS